MQELLESVVKLKRLKAVMVYPGHGKPFTFAALSSIAVR
jgi:glyoxylase-like metal-dependent hydrolase (beta-lactamase superfamily II)